TKPAARGGRVVVEPACTGVRAGATAAPLVLAGSGARPARRGAPFGQATGAVPVPARPGTAFLPRACAALGGQFPATATGTPAPTARPGSPAGVGATGIGLRPVRVGLAVVPERPAA